MPAIAVHHTDTYDAPWDAGVQEKKLDCANPSCFEDMYAWRDPDADPTTKNAYSFPHHTVSPGGKPGAANVAACSAGIGALHGGRGGTNVPESERRGVYTHLAAHLRDAGREPPAFTVEFPVTAGAGYTITLPELPPRAWFDEPACEPSYQLVCTEEGQVYGYLAPANVPHRAPIFRGKNHTVRMDNVDYSKWLKTKGALTDEGWIAAGPMTMGCGHAATTGYGTLNDRIDHYENTCSIVGKLAIGHNKHGVWVAGALEPDITPGQLSRLFVSRLSGDWQPHQERRGWKEMIAALVVPNPGYTASSIDVASTGADGEQLAMVRTDDEGILVASAVPIVPVRESITVASVVDRDVIEWAAARMGVDTAGQLARYRRVFGGE